MIGQHFCSLYVYKARNRICIYIEIRDLLITFALPSTVFLNLSGATYPALNLVGAADPLPKTIS
jgi:hypothetical protein